MTESLINNEQGGFRTGKGCVDQIFTLNHIDEKAQEKQGTFPNPATLDHSVASYNLHGSYTGPVLKPPPTHRENIYVYSIH